MAKYIFIGVILTGLVSSAGAGQLPDEKTYAADGQLMINICTKFAHETDAAKLHKAAVSTQYARVVSCSDYNGECSLYGTFLTLAISVSKDGEISSAERSQMLAHLEKLRIAVEMGKHRLHQAGLK